MTVPELHLSDLALSRRLERAEAVAGASFVEARGAAGGAEWVEICGAYALYDGPASPVTQTFCLGLFDMPGQGDMQRIEGFFQDRGAPVFHEVSPLADPRMLPLLGERGYHPMELTSVMFLPLRSRVAQSWTGPPALTARLLSGTGECGVWADTAARGWSDSFPDSGVLASLFQAVSAREGALSFLAEWEGQAIATGALWIHEGVALLAGASTVPEWRRRGAQRLLLESRLAYAADAGCDLAMICTAPGGESQRNSERQGFRIAYTRIKWQLFARG